MTIDKFISKREVEQYLENSGVNSNEAKKLTDIFEELTQAERDSDVYFTDKRNATPFVVSRIGNSSLHLRKHFDAPFISLSDLYKVLPIPPDEITFFAEWRSGTYTRVDKIMKIFYEDSSRVFQIPICDLINDRMKYETDHKGFITQDSITSMEMKIVETAWELLIEIQMDKSGNGLLLRDEITTKYKVSLRTLEILETNITCDSYILK